MSIDRPTGGDGDPDRFSRREDRPFPAAPADREAAPELPRNTLSMEELRAVYDRSNTLAELQAEAKAYEEAQARAAGSSDSPGPASSDSASTGGEPADGDAAAPLSTRPGVQDAPADGFARPDQPEDLPPFPGAPEDREPAPALPDNVPGMDDLRAMYQKAGSSAELEAMAAESTAAKIEASAPGPGREQGFNDPDGFFGQPGDLQDQGATEPGEQDADERTGPASGTSADASPEPGQNGETVGEKDGEGQVEDGQDRKPKDLVQHPAPHAETDRPAEAAAEAAPDQQPDDPRITAMERQMERMMATVEAMQEKLEASEAKREEDKAAFEQELGDLQAKNSELEQKVADMEAGRGERLAASDRSAESSDELEPLKADSVTEPVTRPDALGAGDDAEGTADSADIIGRTNDEADIAEGKTEPAPDRPELSEAGAAGLGLAGQLGMVHPALQLAVGGDAARRAFEKMSPDEQYDAINTMNSVVNAYGGMSPGTAFLAAVTSAYGPAVFSKAKEAAQDLLHKIRRED